MKKIVLIVPLFLFFLNSVALAAHPLVTDDAGLVGAKKLQVEFTAEWGEDRETLYRDDLGTFINAKVKGGAAGATITLGLHERVDAVLAIPYMWFSTYVNDERDAKEDGLSDVTLDLKWQFFARDGWALALKPGITFPTGDSDRGLGNGRVAYRAYFLASKELTPWAFHVNLGYIRNENKADNRQDLWHASAAAEVELWQNFKLVGNLGVTRNPDPASNIDPAFALGGFIYQLTDQIGINAGVKFGLTKAESDRTYLLGLTVNF